MKRVVVVGDVVLDRDVVGRTERVAPDAPVPVLDVDVVQESPGGAGLTALLCVRPGIEAELIAPMADDEPGRRLLSMLRADLTVLPLPQIGGTRLKTRLRSAGQSLLRVDEGGPGAPDQSPLMGVAEVLDRADVILVSDYGAGTTHHVGLRDLLAAAAARGTAVVWDPHPRGAAPIPGARVVTPNLNEARASASALDLAPLARPEDLARSLQQNWQAGSVCVTAGAEGAYLALPGQEPMIVPAPPVRPGDPCGAGDRFAASLALALAGQAVISDAVIAAVQDASAWVGAGGAAAFRAGREPGESPATGGRSRPVAGAEAWSDAEFGAGSDASAGPAETSYGGPVRLTQSIQASGGTVVATGGCFDVLHVGHVRYLSEARRLGDALIVLLNSDRSVSRLKGPDRPVVPQHERARILLALESVDAVLVFDEDSPEQALSGLRPGIWVKGGDYGAAPMPEADLVRSWGGRVLLLPYVHGHSSSSLLERINQPARPAAGHLNGRAQHRPEDHPADHPNVTRQEIS